MSHSQPIPYRRFSHSRLRYAGIDAVRRLPKEVTGPVVKGTMTIKCKAYTVSKAYKVISERTPMNKIAD